MQQTIGDHQSSMNKANINKSHAREQSTSQSTTYHSPTDRCLFHFVPRQFQLDSDRPLSTAVIQKDMLRLNICKMNPHING